jgi:NAD(P)-dependent dehydrogenase (short-subunit alcohol dehydrogenase family)
MFLGLWRRREELLISLQQELIGPSYLQALDVTATTAREVLKDFITKMGGLDLIVISVSPYHDISKSYSLRSLNYELMLSRAPWEEKRRVIDVCLTGFIALADVAFEFFGVQKRGHFVGISSSSGLRANSLFPYQAAKACISRYMEGARNNFAAQGIPIQVTDVIPGYVAVEHSPQGADPNAYWEVTCEQAGEDIMNGIKDQKEVVYVPGRVRLIAWLLQWMPDWLYNKYFHWLP